MSEACNGWHMECPKDKKHNRFYTVAHVQEEWIVDRNGNFLERVEAIETSSPPDMDNSWLCVECGDQGPGKGHIEAKRMRDE